MRKVGWHEYPQTGLCRPATGWPPAALAAAADAGLATAIKGGGCYGLIMAAIDLQIRPWIALLQLLQMVAGDCYPQARQVGGRVSVFSAALEHRQPITGVGNAGNQTLARLVAAMAGDDIDGARLQGLLSGQGGGKWHDFDF